MRIASRSRRRAYAASVAAVALLLTLQMPLFASAATTLVRISKDPFKNATSAHATQVEPGAYAHGSTIVAAFQSGRYFDGGASDIGWATSTDSGATWKHGFLSGTTIYKGGSFPRISDPNAIYDAKHRTWLIVSLPLTGPGAGAGVLVSRSTDGLTWGNPVTVTATSGTDKSWINCDNTSSSPHYGNCYVEWDNFGNGNLLQISTSSDGGLTWGAPKGTADSAAGIDGLPEPQPNGTVIVPVDNNPFETSVKAFKSTNGGTTWSAETSIATFSKHGIGGGLRSPDLVSAAVNSSGKVYVVWYDCRFESGCSANDIVMSTSTNGTTWSAPVRIPIDAVGSGVDHFLPALTVKQGTGGTSAVLGLTYYYYPIASCSTCHLFAGFVSSQDGGSTWSAPTRLTRELGLGWLAPTNQGPMVGDYEATVYAGSKAFPIFASAKPPSSGPVYHEATYTTTGLDILPDTVPVAKDPVLSTVSTAPTLTSPASSN